MTRSILTGAALVFATVAITSQVMSQDANPTNQSPEMSTEKQAMSDKLAAYATPNDHHKMMGAKIGKWHDTFKFWAAPTAHRISRRLQASSRGPWMAAM